MEYIMANTQNTSKAKESEQKADTSEDLTKYPKKASMPLGASKTLRRGTTATTLRATKKTWTSAELEVLKSKIGLVAGALADFKQAGGLVAVKNLTNDGQCLVKIYLVADALDIVAEHTTDGIDFFVTLEAK
jgi:hypothetical protein